MRSLRSRFIISHILPTVIVLPLAAFALIYLLETQILLKDMADDLTERTLFVAEAVNRQPAALLAIDEAQSLARSFGLHFDGQLLILGKTGELLGSNDPRLDDQLGTVPDLKGLDIALGGDSNLLLLYGFSSHSAEFLLPLTDVNQQLVGIIAMSQTLEGIASLFANLRLLVIGLLALELSISVIIAIILATRLERPISRAANAVIQVSEGERISPIEISGPTEIERLGEAVNILSERLRMLEETRRQLLANLVHEIGRPLGAIRAAIHVLKQGAAEDETTREELLSGIEDEVIRMQPLLDDLAQLHGVILGHVGLNREPISLSDWLPSILLPWRAAALEKELHWSAVIPDKLPVIAVDPDRISQVVGNLLSNAIKYTPAKGSVSISAKAVEAEIIIEIGDTGLGIVPEEQKRVFEPFYRSSRDRRFPQGLGLGLTIARDLVIAHGGELDVISEEGIGSRFIVHLPVESEVSFISG